MAMSTKRAAELRSRMLAWFEREQRPLPWRATRDAYAIWISEAMLQQTRVETVVEYWRRFLQRFPSVRELARAREDEVLALWSGLGYYRRARSLHAAAKVIVGEHGGEFPRDADAVRELPGVGPYTAGAVLSIAFDQPQALVDGNVVRVLSRWFAHDDDYEAAAKWAWDVARELVPRDGGAGAWNQALMELGATVCLPREPLCLLCPVAALCEARKRGLQSELPRAKKRPQSVEVELETLVITRGDSLLLEQRPATGRMAGLWQFPTREVAATNGALAGLFAARFPGASGLQRASSSDAKLGEIRHTITHHRIRVNIFAGRAPRSTIAAPLAWIERDRLDQLALTGMARKILRAGFADPALATPAAQAPRAKLRSRRE
jgi:A/G-specific adenine glycosylase